MPRPIPDRWIPYKACGRVIEGTRLICFKVPLRKAVQVGNSEIKEIWDIPALLKKIPNLGGVIDLTNTNRYYNPREFLEAGVLHQKILMPGRIVPPEDKVQLFMDTVDEFLGKDCDVLVGVHCTHGLNRTGYMVCRYMRDRLNIPAKIAIKRFEKARGYEIERENYIADLLGEEPPPPDLRNNTKVKPLKDNKHASPEKDEDDEKQNDRAKRIERRKYGGNSWRSEESNDWRSEPRGGGTQGQETSSNWRSESRYKTNWRNQDSHEDANPRKSRGDYGSGWRRKRTDSERSFDFKYDY